MPNAVPDVQALVRQLDRPLRAWSVIATVFGDAIVPRGGSLWLGTLLEIMAAFEIEPGGVRQATSRLVGDGWLERDRTGRNSFYRLSERAQRESASAAARIYGTSEPARPAKLGLVIVTGDAASKAQQREQLLAQGARAIAADVFVGLDGTGEDASGIQFELTPRSSADMRALAQMAWPLEAVAASYARFTAFFAPVAENVALTERMAERDVLALRLLVVHELRRIVLRDPGLPAELLCVDWPGIAARRTAAKIWQATLTSSERWLDQNGRALDGALPPAGPDVRRRFGVLPGKG